MNHKLKILIICGPTATGKTSLALHLAREFFGEVVSADSRQVYSGLDLITGKDIPAGYVKTSSSLLVDGRPVPVYQGDTAIWGYDLVSPYQDWSVAHFYRYATAIIRYLHSQGKLPVIVGGTGLYLKELLYPSPSLQIPPDPVLRQELESLSTSELQQKLKLASPGRLSAMNNSDINNPRRLIRAIELSYSHPLRRFNPPVYDPLILGLTAPPSVLKAAIRSRVERRLHLDLNAEASVLSSLPSHLPAASTLGYRQYLRYQRREITLSEAVEDWTTADYQYARRQLVWFKKQSDIHWYSLPVSESQLVDRLRLW